MLNGINQSSLRDYVTFLKALSLIWLGNHGSTDCIWCNKIGLVCSILKMPSTVAACQLDVLSILLLVNRV